MDEAPLLPSLSRRFSSTPESTFLSGSDIRHNHTWVKEFSSKMKYLVQCATATSCCLGITLVLSSWCHSAAHSTVPSISSIHLLRGGVARGSTGSWSASPLGVRRRSRQEQQYPIVQDLDDENKASEQETKDMIDAFLTRDSRNSFICTFDWFKLHWMSLREFSIFNSHELLPIIFFLLSVL